MSKKETYINKTYEDWDSIIVQLNQGEKGVANIKMMRQDLEAMAKNHKANRGEVMEMMVQALEDEYRSSQEKQEPTNAVS